MYRGLLCAVIVVALFVTAGHASDLLVREVEQLTPTLNIQQTQRINPPTKNTEIKMDILPVRYDSASLDSFIRDYMGTAHIPGVATWVMKNGQVIWQQCYGYANLEDSIEVNEHTMFDLASISKTITATAIMQLWERGLFDLDDNINDYLPFNVCAPDYPDSAITFRMLMTHTSSIRDNDAVLTGLWVPFGDSPIPLGTFLQEYLVPGGAYYSTANFNGSVPGNMYEYSSVGIGLVGNLVEAIEDSFPIHCQDSIFDPIGMNHTSWFLSQTDTNNLARPYTWSGSYYLRRAWWGCPWYPGNQLKACVLDLAQHVAAIMQYGFQDTVRILDSTTVALILNQHYQVSSNWWVGLTWHYIDWLSGRWTWCHNGAGQGIDTYMGICPAESSAVVSLTNCDNYGVSWDIADALFSYAQQHTNIEEHTSSTPTMIMLEVNPNPFTHMIDIRYQISDNGIIQSEQSVNLQIYDVGGRLVKDFGRLSVTSHQPSVQWSGDDNAGKRLPCGVYFVTLRASEYLETRKVLLVK